MIKDVVVLVSMLVSGCTNSEVSKRVSLIACLHRQRQWIAIIEEVSVMTRYTFNTFLWMAYIFVQIVLAIHRSPFPSTCAHSSSHSTSSIKWAVGESVNSRYELYGDTSRSSITCSSTCTPPVA